MNIFDIISIIILIIVVIFGSMIILKFYNEYKEENDIGVYKIMKKNKEGFTNEVSIIQEIETLHDILDNHYEKIDKRITELEKLIKGE